jgi:alpha-2-macroglobulin
VDYRRKSNTTYRWVQTFFSIIVISSLLAGCGLPWQIQEEVTSEEVRDFATTEVPLPTQEPRLDLPPALVEVDPIPLSVIPLNPSITLYFNQEMDPESVEAAVHFDPRISGRFTWEDDQTVTFTSDQDLAAGSRLRMALDTSVQAANRENLQEPIELDFHVADHLRVVQVVPASGAQDVDPESVVFISFNQPVVPLGDTSAEAPGFTLSPQVPGTGAWLNTSTYVFTPAPGMNGGTTYTIQLNENLVATSGAGLSPSQAIQYRFTTVTPKILRVLPLPTELLSLNGPVEITFNTRMNTESVEENFYLDGLNGLRVPGDFEWRACQKTVRFTPGRLLSRETTYTIRISEDAQSAGGLTLAEALQSTRRTFPPFAVDLSASPQFESFFGGYGQISLVFTTPLDPDNLDAYINVDPEVVGLRFYTNENDGRLWISGYFQPETTYTVFIDAELKDTWGGQLGEEFSTTLITPPAPPSFSILSGYASYNLIFIPTNASELVLQATNISTLNLEIAPIETNDLITLLHPDNYRYREIFLPEVREVSTHRLNLASNQREVVSLPLSYLGEPLAPGLYYLGVEAPEITDDNFDRNQKYYLIVSENNLVMKIAPDQAFVWGSRLQDQSPLSDVPVVVYTTEGEILTKGRLNSGGQFLEEFERVESPFSNFFALVGEPGDDNFAFSISTWQEAYHLYEMGINIDTLPALIDAYIYTDRPIYRPGDTVNFRTVVFSRDNGLPLMPEVDTVTVSIKGDPGMSGRISTLYSINLPLSAYGTAAGSAVLPDDVPTGYYWIDVSIGEAYIKSLYFDVAAYRKPDIDLQVGFEQAELLVREDIRVEAQADYFFGLPATDQPFSWTLFRKATDFHLPGYRVGPLDHFWVTRPFIPDFSPLGRAVTYGEGITGDDGQMSLTFSAEELDLEDVQKGRLQQYGFEVTVMDQNGFPVSYRDTALVHPETFYIGVQPDAYFGKAGSPFNFSLLTVDWNKSPKGNVPIEVIFEAIRWEVEETGNPEIPYQYVEETTLIGSASPITDREGRAGVMFTPPNPGTYRLTLESGEAVTQVLIWVSGESAALWPAQMHNQISLQADSSDYQPGQIAQIFIPNPFTGGAQALVTTERGRVMSSQVLDIDTSGTTVNIPITDESIPNLFVTAILVGKDANGRPDYRQGTLELTVPPLRKALNVDLSLEPTLTEPGERVTLTLKISDQQGNPIQGEFSIVVVDKALQALVPPNSPPILDAVYRLAPLSVQTSLSLFTYAKQLSISPLEVGGLGGGAERDVEAALREDFPDTAFWQADVITAADGTAQLSIPLPDTLTTWVVEVRGLTEDYLVGQAETEVQTQKPLMIRPVTPRFLVDGDKIEMAAVVHNNTEEDLDIDVSLLAAGFTLTDTSPIQRVTIESGQSMRVNWWGVVESVEAVDLVFQAQSGALADASSPVWGDLQVKRYLMPSTFSTTGQLVEPGRRLELVSLPIKTDPSSGAVSLTLNPSLLGTLIDGLNALTTYPYDSSVSVISKLLANINTYLVLKNLGVESPQLSFALSELIDQDINRLLSAQNFDGGWSWWRSASTGNQNSDPFISAYVLLGLEAAVEAGLEIGEDSLTRAKDYLVFEIDQPGEINPAWALDRLVFQTYALRNHGFNLTPTLNGLYARRSELSPWALGLLALTMRDWGGMTGRVNTLVGDMEGRAFRSATGVHWESDRSSWMLPGTPVFNSAVVVYALAQLDPASPSLPLALRYLLAHQNSHKLWSSSFESSWVIMAVAKTMQGTGDYQAYYDFQATFNNDVIAEGSAMGPDSLDTVTATTRIDRLYPDAPNTLMIERGEGSGTLYYRVDMQTYQPAVTAQAISRGIHLQREYYLAGEGCPAAEGCTAIDSIKLDPDKSAQFITVVLTVNLSHDIYNLMVEDFFPAGTEVLNQHLLTSQSLPEATVNYYDPCDPFANGWGWWFFNQAQIYDDHVLWTADYIPAGTYILTYDLLPYQRGDYQVLPAHAWQYFYPEVQGTTPGGLFKIE